MKNLIRFFTVMLAFFAAQQETNAQCEVTTVYTAGGGHTAYTCPQDGSADAVPFFNSNTSASSYAYAITDINHNILAIESGDSFDFDGAPPGTCFVWGFSYTGNLVAQTGGSVFSVQFSDGCWNISKNAIRVVRDVPEGGSVATPQGATSFYACLNDGISDVIGFSNNSPSNSKYAYVITDDNNIILGLPTVAYQDFAGAGPGVCRVWGLSYTGNLLAELGMNAAIAQLADNCFDLSDNYIEVVRNEVDGGTVTMPNGNTHRSICSQDGNPDVVMFVNTSTTTANYAYAITNEVHEILAITSDSQFDFDVAPSGVCRVWGFSYTGDILAEPGESVFTTRFSEGCWEISATAITVDRTGVDGGTVAMPSGATVRYTCPGDGNDDIVMFTHATTTPNVNYAYVITDDQNNILGLPPGNTQNFEGAGVGVCRVWGLAYTGSITAGTGDNAVAVDLSDGCFSLSSNFIEIIRDSPDGGTVQTTSGETVVNTCAGDGSDDIYTFEHTTSSLSAYRYIITDDQNNILGIPPGNSQNFEGAGSGICRVWGVSYSGALVAQPGDNAAAVALANSCFELSANFIEINRTGVDGGEVTTVDGETSIYTCPGDGVADAVSFNVMTYEPGANRQIVVTDADLNVLGLPPGNTVDFEGAGVGECWVWSLSYTGNLQLSMGDNVADVTVLADGCFHLSDNFVVVNREVPEGGTVATIDGETTVNVVAGDGIADMVEFASSGTSNSNFTYVITDDQNNILGIPPGNSQDFEGAGAGVCRVWGLSYTGTILAAAGDNAATVDLTDDCFDLSDNFIEIIRTDPAPDPIVDNGGIKISLSPNPTPNVVYIDMELEEQPVDNSTTISVFHISGQLIHAEKFSAAEGQNQYEMNLGHLEEGFYRMTVQNGRAFTQAGFVKQ